MLPRVIRISFVRLMIALLLPCWYGNVHHGYWPVQGAYGTCWCAKLYDHDATRLAARSHLVNFLSVAG